MRGRNNQHDDSRYGDGYDEDDYGEQDQGYTIRPKQTYTVTIIGSVVGILLAVLVIVQTGSSEEAVKQIDQERIEQAKREKLKGLKDTAMARYEKEKAEVMALVQQQKENLANGGSAFTISGRIEAQLDHELFAKPGAIELAKVYVEADALKEKELRPGEATDSEKWDAILAEHKALFDEGKYGKAIAKIRDAEDEFRNDQDKMRKVDTLLKETEDTMVARWEKDEEKIKDFALEGDAAKAIAVAEEAIEYGDYEIRKTARAYLNRIDAEAVALGGSKKDDDDEGDVAKSDDDDGDDDDDFGDLDAELEKEKGAADDDDDDDDFDLDAELEKEKEGEGDDDDDY